MGLMLALLEVVLHARGGGARVGGLCRNGAWILIWSIEGWIMSTV